MLVGMASEISKTTHTSVWIAQETTESRVSRLNVHTNQILAHTFSHGTFDFVVSRAIHTLVCVVFADFACHFYILEMFLYLVHLLFWSMH